MILDDRALHEILTSDIPKAQLSKRWSHEFSGQGSIRYRRPHRGRAAIKDPTATEEKHKYQCHAPGKAAPYYFTGEKDYIPILYGKLPPKPVAPPPPPDPNERLKQHNQYTPVDQLIRNGAESMSKTRGKYRHRINTFLRRSPSPPLVRDRARLFGGQGIGRGPAFTSSRSQADDDGLSFSFPSSMTGLQPSNAGDMWVQQEEAGEVGDPESDIFNPTLGQAAGSAEESFEPSFGVNSLPKRNASPSLSAPRAKAQKQMGYIERLAAGITNEANGESAEAEAQTFANGGKEDSNNLLVQQLQAELMETRETVLRQDDEIEMLRDQVKALQSQLAVQEKAQYAVAGEQPVLDSDGSQ